MGLFSNIVDSIKDTVSSITDTTVNFIGNVTDSFKSDKSYDIEVTEGYKIQQTGIFEEWGYDELYDDYRDWLFEIDS